MRLISSLRQIVGRWLTEPEIQLILDTAVELRQATPALAHVWAGNVRGHLYAAAAMLRDGKIEVETASPLDDWDFVPEPRYGRRSSCCKAEMRVEGPKYSPTRHQRRMAGRVRRRHQLVAAAA